LINHIRWLINFNKGIFLPVNQDLYVAIDLGSNSFHMLVVQNISGTPRTIAKVKRKVRLASGLDSESALSQEAMQRGWDCLALFAERLEHIPLNNIKVVSTATLRLATNAKEFCTRAEQILGIAINIISGEQEAALIYQGMAVSSQSADKRLIIDIGGASTELILGQGFTPLVLNSLNMGCVTWLARYFSDDLICQQNIDAAAMAATEILKPVKQDYLNHQWQLSLGASGSIQAVQEVLVAQGLNEQITLVKLHSLMTQALAGKRISELNIVGLKKERRLVFVSGLIILITLFIELGVDTMIASGGALREGLINQLIGQPIAADIRLDCCQKLQKRFQVESSQAIQVAKVAQSIARQLVPQANEQDIELLGYAGLLHEIGTCIEFLQAQKHGHYMLSRIDMTGFSKEQRRFVAALVGSYKGSMKQELAKKQAWCDPVLCQLLITCLRVSVIIVGRGQQDRLSEISFANEDKQITLYLGDAIKSNAPLLTAELIQEGSDNTYFHFTH